MRCFQVLLIAAIGCVACIAQADVIFELQSVDSAGNATTTFASGDAVTIQLVAEDPPGLNPDFTINDLFSFQSRLMASTTDANGATFSYPSFGGTSTSPSVDVPFSDAGVTVSRDEGNGTTPAAISPPSVVLAEFDYLFVNDTTFSFDNQFNHEFSYSTTSIPANVTPQLGETLTVSSAAIPEPTGAIFLVVAGLGIGVKRRRKLCYA